MYAVKGCDISFAVTEDHDVLSWGGKGTGASGHRVEEDFYGEDIQAYLEPKPIRDLVGEEISQVLTSTDCSMTLMVHLRTVLARKNIVRSPNIKQDRACLGASLAITSSFLSDGEYSSLLKQSLLLPVG